MAKKKKRETRHTAAKGHATVPATDTNGQAHKVKYSQSISFIELQVDKCAI